MTALLAMLAALTFTAALLRVADGSVKPSKRQRARHAAAQAAALSELSHGELSVRASFSLSCRCLQPSAATLYRRLSILDAPDFPPWIGAALLDTDLSEAEDLMEHLVDVQLLEVVGRDNTGTVRYRLRSLLRLHARELAQEETTSRIGTRPASGRSAAGSPLPSRPTDGRTAGTTRSSTVEPYVGGSTRHTPTAWSATSSPGLRRSGGRLWRRSCKRRR